MEEQELIRAETVLRELWAIATARATDVLEVREGQLTVRDSGALTPQQQAAIAAIEKGTGGLKVKFYDKLKALELLGKYMGLFEGTGKEQGPDTNLLALLTATEKEVDTHDLPELQQAPADRHDLVEPARPS